MRKFLAMFLTVLVLATSSACSGMSAEKPQLLNFTEFIPHFNEEYVILEKESGKDFIVLNLTDIHINTKDWREDNVIIEVLKYTVTELVNRTQPNLITVSGDLSWACQLSSYRFFADFIALIRM